MTRRLTAAICAAFLVAIGAPVIAASPATAAPGPVRQEPSRATGPVPLLIVLDLSSSMDDDDGSGITKLEGAKRGLVNLVNKQPPGTEMGLWTYPGLSDSCSPGGFVYGAEVGPVQDPSRMAATIEGLKAAGSTPTGDALKGAAEGLRRYGRSDATMILVSDGESNCGNEPCTTAKQLSADGFNITVNTVGFNISADGRRELDCIASATQGRYFDVSSSTELAERLSQTSVPAITLRPTAPTIAPTGGFVDISVEVSNPSARAVPGVEVGLQFTLGNDPSAAQPAVIPPRFTLGGLGPGEPAATRRWRVQTTPRGKASRLHWSIAAWGDSTLPVRVTGTIDVSDDASGPPGDIIDLILRSPHPVAVLGDSYTSGEGASDYLPGDADHADSCHRSRNQYMAKLLGDAGRVMNLACSGALIPDLNSPQNTGVPLLDKTPLGQTLLSKTRQGQLNMLADARAPSAVFMTLGGNDVQFPELAVDCLLPLNSCDRNLFLEAGARSRFTSLDQLAMKYQQIYAIANTREKRSARNGAVAPLIVLPYPKILPDAARAKACFGLNRAEIAFLAKFELDLNSAIESNVKKARESGIEIYYARDVYTAFPPNESMCDPGGSVNYADVMIGLGAFAHDVTKGDFTLKLDDLLVDSNRKAELVHPNAKGTRQIAAALRTWSSTQQRVPASKAPPSPPARDRSSGLVDRRIDIGVRSRDTPAPAEPLTASPGDRVEVTGRFDDGTPPLTSKRFLLAEIHSAPRVLAVSPIAADGSFTVQFSIPPDVPAGRHTLTVQSIGPGEKPFDVRIDVTVKQDLPVWFWGIAGLGPVALVGAGILGLRLRRL